MTSASYAAIGGPDGYLAQLKEFRGNSLRGTGDRREHPKWGEQWGRAPEWVRETYDEFRLEHGQVNYVVYSYATPIALAFEDGTVWVPEVKYSRTTSHGQGICRAWLNYAHRTELVA